MRMAFDFKEKIDRFGISSLSGTIEIDRSIFLESAISTAPSTWSKTAVSVFRTLIGKRPHRAVHQRSAFGCEV
jgi:hypothetical protein